MKGLAFLAALISAIYSMVPAETWAEGVTRISPVAETAGYNSLSRQALHDVAIADVQGPTSPVVQGTIVNIDLTVQNLGTAR